MQSQRREKKRSQKGVFGRAQLPLSKRYLVPAGRGALLLAGAVAGLVALLLAWADVRWGGGEALTGGELSSAHATLDMSCSSCHGDASDRSVFDRVADTACVACHEQGTTEPAPANATTAPAHDSIFGFAVHAASGRGQMDASDDPPACADCHREHDGRDAVLTAVADRQCQSCHRSTDWVDEHPDFAFVAAPDSDDDALHFAHGQHVKELMKRTGWTDLQRTCWTCHQPADPQSAALSDDFGPIDFDRHCADCHLGQGVATSRLAIADGDPAGEPGVWSLERIRRSGLPDTDWAFTTDPNLFRGGSRVVKTRLEHEDPWILFNLRRLRRLRYGDAGVADLLKTAPDQAADPASDYEAAVTALETQAEALRGSSDPAVQAELEWIEGELARVRRQLASPDAQLAGLRLPGGDTAAENDPTGDPWSELVTALAAQCTTCHRMERATLLPIDPDQSVFRRADFVHEPHLLERRCLDCHGMLPIEDALQAADHEQLASLDDRAAILNMPGITTCRDCHAPRRVASACVDCHSFHPDRAARSAALWSELGAFDPSTPEPREPGNAGEAGP